MLYTLIAQYLCIGFSFSCCKDSANRAKYQRKNRFSLFFRDAAYLRASSEIPSKRTQKCLTLPCPSALLLYAIEFADFRRELALVVDIVLLAVLNYLFGILY